MSRKLRRTDYRIELGNALGGILPQGFVQDTRDPTRYRRSVPHGSEHVSLALYSKNWPAGHFEGVRQLLERFRVEFPGRDRELLDFVDQARGWVSGRPSSP